MSQEEMSNRIRAAVAQAPAKMTLQVARDLGVAEMEVVRHLPEGRAVEMDLARWQELLTEFASLGKLHVIVTNSATTLEVVGEFGGFSTWGEFFNVQTDTLDMHIRFAQIAAIFATEKPSHMTGINTLSFQFFDRHGHAAFKVFLSFGGEPPPAGTFERFNELREKYRLVNK